MRWFLIIFLVSTSTVATAQSGNVVIKGKVLEVKTSKPLTGVNVIYGPAKGIITNTNGEFTFTTDTDTLYITITSIGYKTLNETLPVKNIDTLELTFWLEVFIQELEEIVVSASKSDDKISKLTVSIATLDNNIISQNHIVKAEDIINKTSGVEILDGQASIRGGSGYSYGAGSRVMVLIDGLPALSADAGNVKWHFLPMESISKIEIIKGASSVLYGSSALNGIINFRTLRAVNEPITKLTVQSGIYDFPRREEWKWWDTPRIYSNVSFLHARKVGNTDFAIGSYFLQENGYRKDNDKNIARLNMKINREHKKIKELSYGININTTYTEKKDFILWEDADSGALIQNKQTVLELKGFGLTVDPYMLYSKNNKLKHEFQSRFQTTLNNYPKNKQNNSDAYSYFAEYRFWYRFNNKLNVTTGLSELYTTIVSNFYENHDGLNLAGYTQLNCYPLKKLKAIIGIRFEQYSLDGETERITPIFRTGLNYQLFSYTFLRASFGQGYRYPSVAEKHAYTMVGAIKIFPNPYIKSESGWSTEVGIKQGVSLFNWNGQVDIAAFYSQNENLIEYFFGLYPLPGSDSTTFGFKASNLENSRVYGGEVSLILRKSFGDFNTHFNGGYTYMYPVEFNPRTSESSDEYLKYRSMHTLKIFITNTYKRIELGINGIYKSKMLNIDNVFLNEFTREDILPGFYDYWMNNNKGYTVVDGYLAYLLFKKSSLSFSVKNIFNAEYMGRPGDVMPHRSYSLQYKLEF